MGNQLAGIAPSQIFPVEYYLADLPDFSYDASLGSTRFFKVAQARHKEGLTVVKVFVIHDPSLPLSGHRDRLEEIKILLTSVPHCLPFQKFMLTEKAGFLVRQFVKDNLYDRISTRPFLNKIEKRWIAFQLLQCLSQCHKLGVCHGDIKLENIMITSWNWVLLTDFASFKPTYLPEDNPADFSYFFDTSRRRTCYIAPERFIKTLICESEKHSSTVNSAEKSGLTSYLPEKNTLSSNLDDKESVTTNIISDDEVKKEDALFAIDILPVGLDVDQNSLASIALPNVDVKKGDLTSAMDVFSLGCALTELFTEGHAPFDFSQLLTYRSSDHKYSPTKVLEKIDELHIQELVSSMMQIEPSQRLSVDEYLEQQRNKAFPEYFYSFLEDYMKGFASVPILSPDEKIHRLKNDIAMVINTITAHEKSNKMKDAESLESHFSEGLVLIVTLLTSSLRSLKHCTAKLNALEIFRKMAPYLSPDIILDRLLPYMIFLTKDHDSKVRVAVIHALTECLALVENIPRSDINIFPEYILPNISEIAHDDSVVVRMAFAENIALLAETALRYLEMAQIDINHDSDNTCSMNTERSPHHNQVSYDHELQDLQKLIQQSVTTLLSDPVNAVKQILLERGITRLCVFFGRQKGNDVLLSHMITYLNDKEDRHLRGAFFDNIVGVAASVGWQCCPILQPLLQQGLADPEEFIISKALHAMSELTELKLIQKQMLYTLITEAIPLLAHPNLWIRQGAVGFFCTTARSLNLADIQCRLMPLLQPFLKHPVIQVKQELVLLSTLKEPLSRNLYDYLVHSSKLLVILESLTERKMLRSIARPGHPPAYRDLDDSLLYAYSRLFSDGMTEAVEDQILAMKDHLLKINPKKCYLLDLKSSILNKDDKIELSSISPLPKIHSEQLKNVSHSFEKQYRAPQSKKASMKNRTNVESPTVTMNQEWQHMFGSAEQRSPSSPNPQQFTSDSTEFVYPKSTATGKEAIPTDADQHSLGHSDGKSSPFLTSDDKIKSTNPCAPCKDELCSLVRKKQREWAHNEIVREASEASLKEEKLLHKHVMKRPTGVLVAHLHEHKRAVNRVQVVPDSTLFATCSNDGTVKVWDCEKMEGRNIANRSKLTYSRLEGPVSCFTTCQNMQSLAAASDNGNIHVFRMSYESTKSPILHTRVLDAHEEGCAVDINHFDTGSQSMLVYATLYGSIVGWDLRSPGNAWKLENNPRLGLLTSFCVDPLHCWLVVSTASGNMICWDLRFQLPITTVSHPAGSRIRQLLLHPKQQSAVFAAVQGNNEVSLWDMETQARLTTLWASTAPPLSQTQASEHSIYSMCWNYADRGLGVVTGGSDMRIRYWDINNAAESFIFATAANDVLTPSLVNYRLRLIEGSEVIQEIHTRPKLQTNEDPPRRYPEVPPSGHHDCVSAVAPIQTTQSLLISASRDGVVKVWK